MAYYDILSQVLTTSVNHALSLLLLPTISETRVEESALPFFSLFLSSDRKCLCNFGLLKSKQAGRRRRVLKNPRSPPSDNNL